MDNELNLENEYLGITEAAEYLRVSASTLRRWEKKGFLVPERTPTGIRRYTKKQLDDVIQAPQQDHNSAEYNLPAEEVIEPNYDHQSTSNYVVEPQFSSPAIAGIEEPVAAPSEDFRLNEISPTADEEINELRDFFKKAGYDTSTSVEQTKIDTETEWPAAQRQDLASVEIQHMYPQTINAAEMAEPVVKKHEIVPEHLPNIAEPENTQTVPQIESFWRQAHTPAQERIEVFHEEHSDNPTLAINNDDLGTESRSYRTDLGSEQNDQQVQNEDTHQHYSQTEKEPADSKKVYVRFAVIGLSIFVVAFIAWATYSYYSAPVELYSPVVQ